jgi:hypothetical protein
VVPAEEMLAATPTAMLIFPAALRTCILVIWIGPITYFFVFMRKKLLAPASASMYKVKA